MPITQGAAATGANTALSNLATTAINTSLISDTDSTDDLGSTTKFWKNAYIDSVYLAATNVYWQGNYAGYAAILWNTSANEILWRSTATFALSDGTAIFKIDSTGMVLLHNYLPNTDSAYDLGSSVKYWRNTYTDKLFLNSTATIDGATAGHLKFVGDLVPATDNTEWVGEIGTPFKSIKGLVVKDTTNGKHYSVTVVNGTLTTTALD